MDKKVKYIIAVILLLLIASAVCSCKSTQYVPTKEVRIDTIRIVSHDTIKITQHSVPVSVPLPTVYLSNVTKDTVSILNSCLYKSVASIKDGLLHHSLYTLPNAKVNTNVQANDTLKTHNIKTDNIKIDSIPKPYPVNKYIPKPLSWWEQTIMNLGYGALIIIVLIVAYFGIKLWDKFNVTSIIKKII